MNALLQSGILLIFCLELHTFHTMKLKALSINLSTDKTNTFVMVPLSTNFTFDHIHFIFIWFSTNTKDSTLFFDQSLNLLFGIFTS